MPGRPEDGRFFTEMVECEEGSCPRIVILLDGIRLGED